MQLLVAMRPRQWVKNLLIFAVPLISGLQVVVTNWVGLTTAFLAFSMLASAVYLANDVLDVDRDRAHPTKRTRPIAAGLLAPRTAVTATAVLVAGSLALSVVALGLAVTALFVSYLVAMAAYVAGLKSVPIADLMVLAYGYIVRLIAGAAIVEKSPSPYLYLLVAGVAILVSAGRRSSELARGGNSARRHRPVLGHYNLEYLDHVASIGAALSLVAIALWSFDGAERQLYPVVAYASIAPASFALFRYLLHVTTRSASSPEALILSDRFLLTAVALWGLLVSLSATSF